MKKLFYLILFPVILLNCKKGEDSNPQNRIATTIPVINTSVITSITSSTAISGGVITNDGGEPITSRGICWSISPNPIVTGNHTNDGQGAGIFTSNITGLAISTTYYVRSYAVNINGVAYGEELIFNTTLPIVYVVGFEYDGNKNIAMLWKNGVPIPLSNGAFSAQANSVFVSGTDIYIGGDAYIDDGPNYQYKAKIWKNGVGSFISNITNSSLKSLYVVGNDVYAAGSEDFKARVWKNGSYLQIPSIINSYANSIFVLGEDVYASGRDNGTAMVWKNGVVTSYSNNPNGSAANSIFVLGSDVYATGYEDPYVVVWKNGFSTPLVGGLFVPYSANGYSVFVAGLDVYVAGFASNGTKKIAMLWKNGNPLPLTNGVNDALAISVYVLGSDVYVAGYEYSGTIPIAKYWKNGVPTNLTNGTKNAYAFSLIVR